MPSKAYIDRLLRGSGMLHRDHHRHFVPLVACALAAIAVVVTFLAAQPQFTGFASSVTGVGGQITTVNISVRASSVSWVGAVGNFTSGSADQELSLVGGMIIPLNLSFDEVINQTLVVASTVSSPDWSSLSPASLDEINTFLGKSASDGDSAHHTLLELSNVTINETTYEVWSATVRSVNGTYTTGVLSAGGSLLLASYAVDGGIGYAGSPVDFQLLLPIASGGSTNFTFFVIGQESASSLTCNESIGLSAVLGADNVSVDLSWSAIAGATGYEVLYVDGPTDGVLDFSAAVNVSVDSWVNWSDTSDPGERYYRIRALQGASSCVVNETVGRWSEELSPDYNLFSTPFVAVNDSLPETLRSIDGAYSNVNEFNNTAKVYEFYLIVGNSVFGYLETIKPGKGYWIRMGSNATLRLTGSLVGSVSEPVSPDYNLVGFPLIHNSDANNSLEYVLSSIAGNFSNVNEFDNSGKVYEFYLVVGNSVFGDLETIKPGKGYWIRLSANETIEYSNG